MCSSDLLHQDQLPLVLQMVVGGEAYYNTEPEELAVLGCMEFEVLLAERGEISNLETKRLG